MRKAFLVFLAALVLAGSTGCASVQRKFTRKKKEPARIPAVMYVEEGPYQKKFSNEYYYKTHYTLWRTWHDELLNQLGGNRAKVARCAEESYGHLSALVKLLDAETAPKLDEQAKAFERIEKRLSDRSYSGSEEPALRGELERIKRLVSNDFYYAKVKEHVLPDTVDLGGGSAQAAPAAAPPAA
jgi:hypothetical protein